jgi:membrane protein DedA with SNARE-associated domain
MYDWVTITKYAGVAATLLAAGFGLPIPEEVPIVTAGAMVGHDASSLKESLGHGAVGGGVVYYLFPPDGPITRWYYMLPLCIVAVVLGDCVIFLAGRHGGGRLVKSSFVQRRVLPEDKRLKIEENFHKYGIMILLGARLTPGIRTPVFLMAGVLRMPIQRFLLADMLYAIPGVNLLFWLAYWFTDQFVEAIQAVDRHRPMLVLVALSAALGIIIFKFFTTRKFSTGDVSQIPRFVKPIGVVTQAVEQTIERGMAKTYKTGAAVVEKVTHPMGRRATPEAEPAIDADGKPLPALPAHPEPPPATPG